MKKFLSMLLVMVMVFSIGVYATETEDSTVVDSTSTETASTQVSEEPIVPERIYFKSKVIEASEVGEKEYKINYYGQEMVQPVTGQDLKLVVEEGKYRGVEISLVYPLGDSGATEYETPAKVGDKIYLYVEESQALDGSKIYNGEIVMPMDSTKGIVLIVSTVILLALIILLARKNSIKTIGIIALNTGILAVAFGLLYIKSIPALVALAITAIAIIITNTLIINNISRKTLIAIIGIIVATIITVVLSIIMINLTNVNESFPVIETATGTALKTEEIDLIIAVMIIASIGVSVNMAVKTANEYVKGAGVLETIKTVSSDFTKCLNAVLLLLAGTILTNFFYIALNNYPIPMMFLGQDGLFIELIKIIVVVINPIIVVPITAILSKFLIEQTKGIDEAK